MAYGIINADQITPSVAGSSIGAGNASLMKNRLINSAMVIDQRNAGASVTPTGSAYTLDRWQFQCTQSSKMSIQQVLANGPVGFQSYVALGSLSAYSVGAGDFFAFVQKVEGFNTADLQWGTANAKTVTLSFWVNCTLTGTFGGSITNSAGNRSYPFTYTVSAANTWQQISITIAGDTTGTWIGATNGTGLVLYLGMGVGSTYSGTAGAWASANYVSATGATSVVGTSGATFYITGVQLEVGSSATGFEYRQYGQELALCQRYFEKIGGSGGSDIFFGTGAVGAGYDAYSTIGFNASKRAIPTVTKVGTWSVVNCSQPIVAASNLNTMTIVTSSTAGSGQVYTLTNGTSTYLTASAEL